MSDQAQSTASENISASQEQGTRVADKVLTDNNGEIGYFVKKGTEFVPMTNFSVACTGYVVETPSCGSSEGFLFRVLPKTSLLNGEDFEIDAETSQQYYLTWRDMSTQQGILSKFASKKLWTVPSKDQYLPAYFKRLCDDYVNSGSPRRVFPVECLGLQRSSAPPTWVLGSNLHVVLSDIQVAERVPERLSPYAALGNEIHPLPFVNIQEDSILDGGLALKDLIKIQEKYLGDNFPAALLMLGGMGVAIHYEQLASLYDGVPLIMAFGDPVSGKSLAAEMAMSLFSEGACIGECTQAGILKMVTSQTLPFWWDDVSDFNTLEGLVVQTFNQSQRKTAKKEKDLLPRTVPIITMNPQCLFKKKKLDKEKISRVFSRIAVIPFNKVSGNQRLERCLSLKAELQPVLERMVLSVGTLIELRSSFATMKEDDLFKEICDIMGETILDMRSQMNYALVLFATGKILEKLQLRETYQKIVESFFSGKVVPRHIELLAQDGGKADSAVDYNEEEEAEMMSVVNRIVQSCSVDPEKTKHFFIPKASLTKCKCGEVMGFKVDEALAFIGEKGKEQALKRFISKTGRGCVGRLTLPGRGQLSGCLHIQRHLFSNDTLNSNDEAFLQHMKKKVSGDVFKESEEAAASGTSMPADTILNDKVPTPLEAVEDDDEDLLQSVQALLPAEMSQRSKVPETGEEEGTSSNFKMDQDDLDKLALDEEFAKASLVRKVLENPRLKNQATKRKLKTDKLQDGLTPREVVSGKRARKTTKK